MCDVAESEFDFSRKCVMPTALASKLCRWCTLFICIRESEWRDGFGNIAVLRWSSHFSHFMTPNSSASSLPVIAIDGPTASGKGTVAHRVADALGFHYLDSGALYRLTALAATRAGAALTDEAAIAEIARNLETRFIGETVLLSRIDVTDDIRTEIAGQNASVVAAMPSVRAALLERQRAFVEAPGLVADGRDMGSVVFPNASLKVFLTASVETRAERRLNQLIQKGNPAILQDVVKELRIRDERDINRSVAPLKRLEDAQLLDTTGISANEAVKQILDWYKKQ
jgi:CMP/dCMP kinase